MDMLDDASRALVASHSLLTNTLENINQGICVIDADMNVAAWNGRFLELHDFPANLIQAGMPLAEMVRFNADRGDYVGGRDIDSLQARVGDLRIRNLPEIYERQRPDGMILEVAVNAMPGGGFVATFSDVTERHVAAKALRNMNEALEQRVKERTEALAAASVEAERANQAKTRFLAAVSHDLQQPLHAARLFVSALSEQQPNELVDRVDAALQSATTLLDSLLQVAQLDGGAILPNVVLFPLSEVFDVLHNEFLAIAGERGVRMSTVQTCLTVRSDPALLRRALQNFLSNAVRYSRRGRMLLGCRRLGSAVRVEVWDTGPGIPSEKFEIIFEEFRRLDNLPGADLGLGLGLTIARRIANLLDHKIAVRSKLGVGSCFSVELPIIDAKGVLPVSSHESRPDLLRGTKILCVDNDPLSLNGMRALLRGWGCEVIAARNGAEAEKILDRRAPNIMLLDYHLDDGKTGLDVFSVLIKRFNSNVPAVVITADQSGATRKGVEDPGCRILYKPLRPAKLRALLTQIVRRG